MGEMKRAVLASAIGHVVVFVAAWIAGMAFSQPVQRSYPRTITATLLEKPQVTSPQQSPQRKVEPPPPQPKPVVEPKKAESVVEKPVRKPQPATLTRSQSDTPKDAPATSGALKIDAAEFPFPEYLALIQYRIETQWQPPLSGRGNFLTTVFFRIMPDGRVIDIRIEKTSGNFVMDQAALRAVSNANPLPPLPEGSGLPSLGVHFDFLVN